MVYLISEDILKSEGLIDSNLWGGYIKPAIKLAQDRGLQTLIGGVMYDRICEMVGDGSIKDIENKKYKFFLDEYVIPYLMWQVMAEVATPISWKFKNQGLVSADSDYTTQPSMKDFQYVVKKYGDAAVFYGNRLTDYLSTHCDDYPEYHKHICGKMHPEKKDYNTGLYLGK